MSHVSVMADKEFRGYFTSLAAYFFILVFVAVTVALFFFKENFFGGGRAEVRGFFYWMPAVLLILVPGLTMRQWAREREMGSIEILMTLPARTHEIVFGKFLACIGLVVVALLFTLGIPITAATYGDLDWGPVFGGYIAAMFLAAAYTAIGLFVSSLFRDQFLSLLMSIVVCGAFAVISSDFVLGAFGFSETLTEVFEFIGFWSRFHNIERGVLDFRDIAYYLTVTGMFLFANVAVLRSKRWA